MIAGHCQLNRSLTVIKVMNDPTCRLCRQAEETFEHLMRHCLSIGNGCLYKKKSKNVCIQYAEKKIKICTINMKICKIKSGFYVIFCKSRYISIKIRFFMKLAVSQFSNFFKDA